MLSPCSSIIIDSFGSVLTSCISLYCLDTMMSLSAIDSPRESDQNLIRKLSEETNEPSQWLKHLFLAYYGISVTYVSSLNITTQTKHHLMNKIIFVLHLPSQTHSHVILSINVVNLSHDVLTICKMNYLSLVSIPCTLR